MKPVLKQAFTILFTASTLFYVSGCSKAASDSKTEQSEMTATQIAPKDLLKISGAFNYRERRTLPQGAYALISLQDISDPGAKALNMAQIRMEMDGLSVPIRFTLYAPTADLKPEADYTIRVDIHDRDNTLIWAQDRRYSVDPTLAQQDIGSVLLILVYSD